MKAINKNIIIICLLIILSSIFIQLNILINPNSAWHLFVAQQLLAGKKLYVDIIEVNFPFIYYLRTLPHLVQQYIGISYITASTLLNITVTLTGFLASVKLLKYTELQASFLRKNAVIAGLCFGMFVLPYTLTQNFFGEKEQLIMAMLMPYIITGIVREEYYNISKYKRAGIALFAALGICIKPLYTLVFLAVEAYALLHKEKRRLTEQFTIIISGLIYIFFILTVTPEFFAASSLRNIIYSTEPWYFFFFLPFTSIHAFFFLLVVIAWPSCKKYKTQFYFLVMFITCIVTASIHLKINDYYFYPAMLFAMLLFSTPIASFFAEFKNAIKSNDMASSLNSIDYYNFMAVLFIVPYLIFVTFLGTRNLLSNRVMDDYCGFSRLKAYIENSEQRKVAIFGSLPDAFPLVNYTGSVYSLRYSGVWVPCGINAYRADKNLSPEIEEIVSNAEEFYVAGITEDLATNKPDIIIINSTGEGNCFNPANLSSRYPDFSQKWKEYTLSSQITTDEKKSAVYDIYLRK